MKTWIYTAAIITSVALQARAGEWSGLPRAEIVLAQLNFSSSTGSRLESGSGLDAKGLNLESGKNTSRLDRGSGLDMGRGLDTGRGLELDRAGRSGTRFESRAGKGDFEFGAGANGSNRATRRSSKR